MPRVFEGQLNAPSGRLAIVVSRYNESITSKLLDGAVATLTRHGVADDAIDVFWVPGAFEIPTIAEALAGSGQYAAVLCLGAVIRGETTHDQHINRAVSATLAEIGVRQKLPVLFGILTCDTVEQAINRAGGTMGNKGSECAEAALRMIDLLSRDPTRIQRQKPALGKK
jgi:6,7-dimethyl-8-ribityllumazine synthase